MYWKIQYRTAPYLFMLPFVILFFVFTLYPFLFSIYVSLTDWNGSQYKTFIGLDNYVQLIKNNEFWEAVWNSSIIFILYVPAMILIALLLAVCLNQPWLKWKGYFRTVFFIPNITSVVAISFVFVLLFNTREGLINNILLSIGILKEPIPFLETPFWARISVAIVVLFRWTGYNMLLMLAGLQNIPDDIYEAAKIDGASPVKTFFHIIIPMLRKMILFCTILSTIGTFSLFVEPYLITKGGPNNATTTPVLLLFRESFQNFNFGYASAISIMFFILMMLLTVLQLNVFRDKE